MKTVVVASQNPVKLNAARIGFQQMFPEEQFKFITVDVSSNVKEQPLSDRETYLGANNRARNAFQQFPKADYWVGIEGGIEKDEKINKMMAFAWVVVLSKERNGIARTGTFELPVMIASLISEGIELGDADDIVFSVKNSKKTNGAVGLLTGNIIHRATYYAHAVILALIPFKNPQLYL